MWDNLMSWKFKKNKHTIQDVKQVTLNFFTKKLFLFDSTISHKMDIQLRNKRNVEKLRNLVYYSDHYTNIYYH